MSDLPKAVGTCTSWSAGHSSRAWAPRMLRFTPWARASYETAMREPLERLSRRSPSGRFSVIPPAPLPPRSCGLYCTTATGWPRSEGSRRTSTCA